MHTRRYIAHIDMDAFFASVEQRDNPTYAGKPVVVGSDPKAGKGRGVVAACSYEARKFGIHSAMPISIAYRKCPDAVFLPVNMEKYAEASDEVSAIFERFTPDIEPISIDEAFLDITGSHKLFGTPEETCLLIKKTIKKETRLTASIGLAPNMMTAKIASDIKKPDGFVSVDEKDLLNFLHPLAIGKLWGVGEKTEAFLKKIGIHTIGELAKLDRKYIETTFGKSGEHMWELANGIDPRQVRRVPEPARSVSNEFTFDEDTKDPEKIKNALMFLSEKVSLRLRISDMKCNNVILKIRFHDFRALSRSKRLDSPTNFISDIYRTAVKLMAEADPGKDLIRLLGVGTSSFSSDAWEHDLFPQEPGALQKKENIHKALDKIKYKFGGGSIGYRG